MNLVVATRHEGPWMRFEVEGWWGSGDALKLAYIVKAAAARVREDHVLIDLSRVATPREAKGKFLICDRLRRALAPRARVGVVAPAELVDGETVASQVPAPDIALFHAESDAIDWLAQQP